MAAILNFLKTDLTFSNMCIILNVHTNFGVYITKWLKSVKNSKEDFSQWSWKIWWPFWIFEWLTCFKKNINTKEYCVKFGASFTNWSILPLILSTTWRKWCNRHHGLITGFPGLITGNMILPISFCHSFIKH